MSRASIAQERYNTQESNITRLCESNHTNDPEFTKNNNSTLFDPCRELICWQCHSTDRLTAFHTAGGKVAICATCKNNGGLV